MKKALFLLGAVAAMGFVACNSTSDCDCTIGDGLTSNVVEVLEFDGACEEITATDLPAEYQDYADYDFTMTCVEK